MSFWDGIIGISQPQINTQKKFSKEERVAFEGILNGFQESMEDNIWSPQPYTMTRFDKLKEEKKPENCRNCGSAHTRIKRGVTICSYCGSRTP